MSSQASVGKQQLGPLTSMRFFLALWVIAYHVSSPGSLATGWWSELPHGAFLLLRGALTILDIFFISSGFILAYHYQLNTRWSRHEIYAYLVARFSRLMPIYVLGLLLMAPFALRGLVSGKSLLIPSEQIKQALLVWTLMQSWFPTAAMAWNYPSWSLSADAFFYLLFPVLGVVFWRASGGPKWVGVISALWIWCLSAPLVAVVIGITGFGDVPMTAYITGDATFLSRFTGVENVIYERVETAPELVNFFRYNPLLRLPEFLMGIVTARVFSDLRSSRHYLVGRGYWLYIPALAALSLALLAGEAIPFPLAHNGLFAPLCMCIILGFALGGGVIAKVLSLNTLVFLGGASYSMYLLHVPVFKYMASFTHHIFSVELETSGPWLWSYVVVVIVISCIVHSRFEMPANNFIRRRLTRWVHPPEASNHASQEIVVSAGVGSSIGR